MAAFMEASGFFCLNKPFEKCWAGTGGLLLVFRLLSSLLNLLKNSFMVICCCSCKNFSRVAAGAGEILIIRKIIINGGR